MQSDLAHIGEWDCKCLRDLQTSLKNGPLKVQIQIFGTFPEVC